MMETRVLFGRRIVPHHMLTYAEQIYDILLGEIEAGRWKVNDRLPGVINLARETGFGTKTVQAAYDRLKEEGYLRTLGYRGTYLRSVTPSAPEPTGRIGALVGRDQVGDPLILWYEHVILQVARKRGLLVEMRVLPEEVAARDAARAGRLFGNDAEGILSLLPFHVPESEQDSNGRLPVAFLCAPFEFCTPRISADVREAYYELTSRLIRMGHRQILFSEDSIEPDPRQTWLHREGYLEAMREHGLAVDETLWAPSRDLRNTDLAGVAQHLRLLLRRGCARPPTAVVAGSLGRSMALVRAAPLGGVSIPRDLSVVSIGSGRVDGPNGTELTGMLPDAEGMVEKCLSLIEEQKQPHGCDTAAWFVRMRWVPGETVAPAEAAAPAGSATPC